MSHSVALVLSWTVVFSVSLGAQQRFEGTITDEAGQPVKGVLITVHQGAYTTTGQTDVIPIIAPPKLFGAIIFEDPNRVNVHYINLHFARTDDRGHYEFKKLAAGTYSFSARGEKKDWSAWTKNEAAATLAIDPKLSGLYTFPTWEQVAITNGPPLVKDMVLHPKGYWAGQCVTPASSGSQNAEQINELVRQAAKGDARAMRQISLFFVDRTRSPIDGVQAGCWMQLAADKGDGLAQLQVLQATSAKAYPGTFEFDRVVRSLVDAARENLWDSLKVGAPIPLVSADGDRFLSWRTNLNLGPGNCSVVESQYGTKRGQWIGRQSSYSCMYTIPPQVPAQEAFRVFAQACGQSLVTYPADYRFQQSGKCELSGASLETGITPQNGIVLIISGPPNPDVDATATKAMEVLRQVLAAANEPRPFNSIAGVQIPEPAPAPGVPVQLPRSFSVLALPDAELCSITAISYQNDGERYIYDCRFASWRWQNLPDSLVSLSAVVEATGDWVRVAEQPKEHSWLVVQGTIPVWYVARNQATAQRALYLSVLPPPYNKVSLSVLVAKH